MKISYGITVHNEVDELTRLLDKLITHIDKEDEIVILYDSENGSSHVENFLRAKSVNNPDFTWHSNPLNKDFAQQKNYLTKMCTGDWIFLIDADEYPDEYSKSGYFHLTKNNLIRRVLECHAFWESRITECVSNSTRPSYEETCLLLHRELDKMYINL